MIVPQESAARIARPQVEEICDRERIKVVFPKPFCDLHLEPQDDKPLVQRFIAEFGIGRPEVRVEVDRRGRIAHVEVLRSASCGSTWFVAKQLEGIEVEDKRELYERISESHQFRKIQKQSKLSARHTMRQSDGQTRTLTKLRF